MPTPTDVLNEDVKELRESNRQLAAEFRGVFDRLSADMRDSNQRLTDAISGLARDFNNFRVDVSKELAATRESLKGEIATVNTSLKDQLGATRESLKEFQGRTETSFRVAVWGVTLAATSILGLFGAALTATWRAAHADATVAELKEREARIVRWIESHGGSVAPEGTGPRGRRGDVQVRGSTPDEQANIPEPVPIVPEPVPIPPGPDPKPKGKPGAVHRAQAPNEDSPDSGSAPTPNKKAPETEKKAPETQRESQNGPS